MLRFLSVSFFSEEENGYQDYYKYHDKNSKTHACFKYATNGCAG